MVTKRTDEFRADRADERADTKAGSIGFGCWSINAEQMDYGAPRH